VGRQKVRYGLTGIVGNALDGIEKVSHLMRIVPDLTRIFDANAIRFRLVSAAVAQQSQTNALLGNFGSLGQQDGRGNRAECAE